MSGGNEGLEEMAGNCTIRNVGHFGAESDIGIR
jgi:hypothetical protein